MHPKFENKAYLYGFTFTQVIFLSFLLLAATMLFPILAKRAGFIWGFGICLGIIAVPAGVLRILNINIRILLVEWFYFHFIRPKIYLPGQRGD